MKNKTSSKKTLVSSVIIIVAVAIAYFFYMGNKAPSGQSLLETQVTPEANAASSRILALLNQIRSLKIDTEIFDDPVYQTLIDYSVAIPDVPVGRLNPFAPIPGVPIEGSN